MRSRRLNRHGIVSTKFYLIQSRRLNLIQIFNKNKEFLLFYQYKFSILHGSLRFQTAGVDAGGEGRSVPFGPVLSRIEAAGEKNGDLPADKVVHLERYVSGYPCREKNGRYGIEGIRVILIKHRIPGQAGGWRGFHPRQFRDRPLPDAHVRACVKRVSR